MEYVHNANGKKNNTLTKKKEVTQSFIKCLSQINKINSILPNS